MKREASAEDLGGQGSRSGGYKAGQNVHTDRPNGVMCTHEVVKGYDDIVYIDGSNIQWDGHRKSFHNSLLCHCARHGALSGNLSKVKRQKAA